jgi:hypothetical protein
MDVLLRRYEAMGGDVAAMDAMWRRCGGDVVAMWRRWMQCGGGGGSVVVFVGYSAYSMG